MRRWSIILAGAAFVMALSGPVFTQEVVAGGGGPAQDVLVPHLPGPEMAWESPVPAPPGAATVGFVASLAGGEAKIVKNKPYAAEGVTETSRSLADGTKIERKTTSKFYRDSDGRTRREHSLGSVPGPWGAVEAPPAIFIHDPVKEVMYTLHPDKKMAEKIVFRIERTEESENTAPRHTGSSESEHRHESSVEHQENVWIEREPAPNGGVPGGVPGAGVVMRRHDLSTVGKRTFFFGAGSDSKEESLGERNIEGVACQGTRIVTTIPAGKIGNNRPIEIVHESWYSPELEAMVLQKTVDPMNGDVTYRLTNIERGDPPASVFEVPPDYKVEERGRREIRIQRRTFRQPI